LQRIEVVMSDQNTGGGSMDFSTVSDPEVRRSLRAMQQQMNAAIERQQCEIQAILEALFEKHVTSIGEFRRHLLKLQQHSSRGERIHEVIASSTPAPPKPAAPKPEPPVLTPEQRRYRL
jgi:hypothetical protein